MHAVGAGMALRRPDPRCSPSPRRSASSSRRPTTSGTAREWLWCARTASTAHDDSYIVSAKLGREDWDGVLELMLGMGMPPLDAEGPGADPRLSGVHPGRRRRERRRGGPFRRRTGPGPAVGEPPLPPESPSTGGNAGRSGGGGSTARPRSRRHQELDFLLEGVAVRHFETRPRQPADAAFEGSVRERRLFR